MENYKTNYRKTVAIVMVIILLLVILTVISYYKEVEIVTNISLCFLIACTTGVIIEVINGSKEKDSKNVIEYKKELKEMKYKIISFKKGLNNLSKNRNRYSSFDNADRLMETANKLNEQINYLYENKSKRSLVKNSYIIKK